MPAEPPPILVLVKDLLFATKIGATARAEGIAIKLIRDPAKLFVETADRLIVDLNQDGALEAAVAWQNQTPREIIGFVSHVDADLIKRARTLGIDRILPRSRFVEIIPDLLKGAEAP